MTAATNALTTFAAATAPTAITPADAAPATEAARADQRLARRYFFDDTNMDLFFLAAIGWGVNGGLSFGEALHVKSTIVDGDAVSWVRSFADHGALQGIAADDWLARGCLREAGEARLKSFAAYRSAWQFAVPGAEFDALYASHRQAFGQALRELSIRHEFFAAPYAGRTLPGVYLPNEDADAPVVLIIGGADTCFEDLFLGYGRDLVSRGYSVAIADLPGQGRCQAEGLYWETEAEKPIAAIVDVLAGRFAARRGRIALLGLSLGGYFVTRAAGHEPRLATVIASTPFPNPAELFAKSVHGNRASTTMSSATLRSFRMSFWKAGASNPQEFLANTAHMTADPALVTLPFLSILGTGDSAVFAAQARQWHRDIASADKKLVVLDAATGADGHCQVANRRRLVQECAAWLKEIFAR
ncbi:MAG TPA: alpha/beta fold hydrolase [Steroidobacteraceae bacterium]|nr:alpha/beta fold hydrolase [Steroidobacteraceae bacterium]